MAHITADRVRDTSTTTGTGNFTVSGSAQSGYRTFSAVLSVSDTFYYAIQHQTANEWEVGLGTYSSANTITRTTVYASSAGGSAVTFSSGTKDVFLTLAATRTLQLDNDGDVIISANSSSDALRITQTGAGNALRVEDNTNPDATPIVITGTGILVGGSETAVSGVGLDPRIQLAGTSASDTFFGTSRWSATANAGGFDLYKSRGAAPGTYGLVSSGDTLGQIRFAGDDGSQFVLAAQISSFVDGAAGANDMPGRLVFSTTADGASSPTERMRIDSAGNVGIGSTSLTANTLRVDKNITGGTSANGVRSGGIVQSDVTSAAISFLSIAGASATTTLTTLAQFQAQQGTFTAGAAVTNQYGFSAHNSLTGATNNYGFFSNIASGTGRWNFYANGTANNYFAGQVQLGAGTVGAPALSTTGDTNTGIFFPAADTLAFAEGGVEAMRIDSSSNVSIATGNLTFSGTGQRITGDFSSATTAAVSFQTSTTNGVTSVTAIPNGTSQGASFRAFNGVDQANASWGYLGIPGGGGDTRIISGASGTGSYLPMTFYTGGSERMRIDTSGNFGIGTSSPGGYKLNVSGTALVTSSIVTNSDLQVNPSGYNLYLRNISGTNRIDSYNSPITATVPLQLNASQMTFQIADTERARITAGGEVYIAGTTDQGAYNLQVNGTGVWGAGAYVNGSDARLKEEVKDLPSATEIVASLRPVTFRYKSDYSRDNSIQPGFIAQELQQALSETEYVNGVVHSGPDYLNVAYQNLIPILTKALQEATAEISSLKARVAALENA